MALGFAWALLGFPVCLPCTTAAAPRLHLPVSDFPYTIDVWQVEQGLPDNSVTSIAQTSDGYLWFGTFSGLVRFDGLKFTVFDSNTPGLPSERILRLFRDRSGNLWISTEQGHLVRYSRGSFQSYGPAEGWPMRPCQNTGIAFDPAGAPIFLTNIGELIRFDGSRFAPLGVAPYGEVAASISNDAKSGAICSRYVERFEVIQGSNSVPIASIRAGIRPTDLNIAMAPAAQGGMWMLEQMQLVRRDRSGVLEKIPGEARFPSCLLEDSSGQLWVGTWGEGLVLMRRDGTRFHLLARDGLPNEVVRYCMEDREGNIWLGTNGGGLARLRRKAFTSLACSIVRARAEKNQEPMPNPIPLSVCEVSPGVAWVGCLDVGVFSLPLQSPITTPPHIDDRIGSTGVWGMLKDGPDTLWLGTYGQGFARVDSHGVGFFTNGTDPHRNRIIALCKLGRDLWLGTDGGGVSRFDGDRFETITTADGLLANQVWTLAGGRDGTLWIGSLNGGLTALKDRQLSHFTTTNGLPHRTVRTLLSEPDGTLWIGTGRGLCVLHKGVIQNFRSTPELAEPEIVALVDDGLGYLWLGSNRGLLRCAKAELIDAAEGRLERIPTTVFTTADGLLSMQISSGQSAGTRLHDGRLIFATVKGVNLVDPRSIRPNPVPPTVLIESIAVDGQPVKDWVDTVQVPSGPRRLEVNYTGLSLTAPERVRFEYRLEGVDRAWRNAGGSRVASYQGLPPGPYEFRVRAANSDGVWSVADARLSFEILPAFWQTWWFRACCASAALGLTGFTVRRRFRSLEQARKAQQDFSRRLMESQEQERKRLAAELHDSFGQNLLVIKNRAVMGLAPTADPARMQEQLVHVSDMASQAIREVRAMAQNLRPFQLDEMGLTKALLSMIRRLGESSGIEFHAEIPDLDTRLRKEDEIHFYRIVQECLTNAVKHSRARTVRVTITCQDRIHASIEDDGAGFDPASAAAGLGLRSIRERVAALGGVVEFTSSRDAGTRVNVIVPVQPTP